MAQKAKRQKFGISFLMLFLLFGGVFGAVGIVGFQSLAINETWERVEGTVTDVASHRGNKGGTLYAPVVSYEVEGREYEVTSRSSSSIYPTVGVFEEVAYNPARPDQAKLIEGSGTKILFLIFLLIGLGFVIGGPLLFLKSFRRSKTIAQLMTSGQKVTGVIVDIEKAGRSNKKNLYKITVSAPDASGGVKNYKSDALSDVGGLLLIDLQKTPVSVDVFIDSANSDQYYVDVSDIPGLTIDRISDLVEMSQKEFGGDSKL